MAENHIRYVKVLFSKKKKKLQNASILFKDEWESV